MTTITVPRAVLERALEAMDKATRFMSDSDYVKLNQAITALRAALAQQEQDWSMLQATQESLREHMSEINRLRAALAQQEREPPTDWEAVAADQAMTIALLLEALRLTSIDCQYLHHAHKDRHLLFEECPVVARINAAIAKAEAQP
jgi:uncharacterized coiled-coil protein SlyX